MFFDFQTKTPVSIFLYVRLYSNSLIFGDKPNENLKVQFVCQRSEIFVWYPTVVQTQLLCIQAFFYYLSNSPTQKYCLLVML